jgi:hypothetical protein
MTLCDFSAMATCYAEASGRNRPLADTRASGLADGFRLMGRILVIFQAQLCDHIGRRPQNIEVVRGLEGGSNISQRLGNIGLKRLPLSRLKCTADQPVKLR